MSLASLLGTSSLHCLSSLAVPASQPALPLLRIQWVCSILVVAVVVVLRGLIKINTRPRCAVAGARLAPVARTGRPERRGKLSFVVITAVLASFEKMLACGRRMDEAVF